MRRVASAPPRLRDQSTQLPLDLPLELSKARLRGRRLRMNHDVERRQQVTMTPLTVNLPQAALDPVSDHRSADFASDCDAEPGTLSIVSNRVDGRIRSMPSAPRLITSSIIYPPPKSTLRRRKPRRPGFTRTAHASIYADRRERPLRRRRERIARPCRVRMRARNPCFFFRRRLLG